MNVPPNPSFESINVKKKKKYPQIFYEIMVSLIVIFPQLIAYYALASLFVLPFHASNISISVWRVVITFESYLVGFIFTCSTIFTAAILFFTFKLPTSPSVISIIKQYFFIFLWLSFAMIGYNINFLVLSVSTMVIIFPSFVFPLIADFVILLFLVMNAYAIGFWVLARTVDRLWVFESSSVNDGLKKESIEFFQGKYVRVCVVMTGFLAIGCVIESPPHKVLVIMFMSGIMAIVAVIIKLVKNLFIHVWMDNVSLEK